MLSRILQLVPNDLGFIKHIVTSESGDSYWPQVTKGTFSAIPIRRIDFTTPADERAAAAAAGQARYTAALASADPAPLLAFVDDHLAPRTDVIHDLLAFLAQRMIDLNRAKAEEMRGFLTWLDRHTGGTLDDLPGKTKIQGYPGNYQKGDPPLPFDELLDVLVKNKRKLSKDPTGRAFQERLEREYTASVEKVRPLTP